MSDLFLEKVSRFLMSRHLMSSHLKKKMRWLLMRCLLIDTWTGLLLGMDRLSQKSLELELSLQLVKMIMFYHFYGRQDS